MERLIGVAQLRFDDEPAVAGIGLFGGSPELFQKGIVPPDHLLHLF